MKKIVLTALLSLVSVIHSFSCGCEPFWDNFWGMFTEYSVRFEWWDSGSGCCSGAGGSGGGGGYVAGVGIKIETTWDVCKLNDGVPTHITPSYDQPGDVAVYYKCNIRQWIKYASVAECEDNCC